MNELDVDEANALEKVNGMTHILLVGIDARPGQKTAAAIRCCFSPSTRSTGA
jgi:hypothetical protein